MRQHVQFYQFVWHIFVHVLGCLRVCFLHSTVQSDAESGVRRRRVLPRASLHIPARLLVWYPQQPRCGVASFPLCAQHSSSTRGQLRATASSAQRPDMPPYAFVVSVATTAFCGSLAACCQRDPATASARLGVRTETCLPSKSFARPVQTASILTPSAGLTDASGP